LIIRKSQYPKISKKGHHKNCVKNIKKCFIVK